MAHATTTTTTMILMMMMIMMTTTTTTTTMQVPDRMLQCEALDRALFASLAAALTRNTASAGALPLVTLLEAAVRVVERRPAHVDALFERAPAFASTLVAAYDAALANAAPPGRAHVEQVWRRLARRASVSTD